MIEDDENPGTESEEGRRPLPFWKKTLVALSLVSMAIGGGLKAWSAISGGEQDSEPVATQGTDGAPAGALAPNSLVDGGTGSGGSAAEEAEGGSTNLSPAFLRLGFGFFVGFCIGFALRAFFRISAIAFGVVLLSIFGLQYAGVLDVQWDIVEGHWNGIVDRIRAESADFLGFVTGSLPTAGLAGLGLFTGFKKS